MPRLCSRVLPLEINGFVARFIPPDSIPEIYFYGGYHVPFPISRIINGRLFSGYYYFVNRNGLTQTIFKFVGDIVPNNSDLYYLALFIDSECKKRARSDGINF